MTTELRLAIHHIGGRSGGHFELNEAMSGPLASALTSIFYDPAADALEGMAAIGTARRAKTIALPYALGDRTGTHTLYETYDPYTSSLRKPLDEPLSLWMGYDYPFNSVARVVRTSGVTTYRLDELPELRDGRVLPPDVLVIDTQGFEREVIAGAGELLRGVVMVVAETPLRLLYEGAAPFSEIMATLDAAGLRFATFSKLHTAQPYRLPLGLRGQDFAYEGDSVYLRDLERTEDATALAKTAAAAHLFGYHAYAFEAQRRYAAAYGENFGQGPLAELLTALLRATARMPVLKTLAFDEIYSEEESIRRTDPRFMSSVERVVSERLAQVGRTLMNEQRDVLVRLAGPADSPIEEVLRGFGLSGQADALRNRRMRDTQEYLRTVGITVTNG